MSYDRFVDEPLTSRDALNKFQIKIKILDLDDARDFSPRYGRRVLVKRILLTIKHILTEEIEENWMWKNLKSECGTKGFFHLQTDGFRQVRSKMAMY